MEILSIALLQKNDTGVSPRYSYKLFLYLLFYISERRKKTTNLMLNVLLTTFTFLFILNDLWSCLKIHSKLYIFVFQ